MHNAQNSPTDTQTGKRSDLPAIVSKKWLGAHFGLSGCRGYTPTRALFSKILTKEVCEAAGLDMVKIRSRHVKQFTALETQRIYSALNLI